MSALLFLALVVVYMLGVGGIVFVGWLVDGAPRERLGLEAQLDRARSAPPAPSRTAAAAPDPYFVTLVPTA